MNKKFTVNIKTHQITPYVVEAKDEFEAVLEAIKGNGYIHESGSIDIGTDPLSWNVESYTNFPFNVSKQEMI